MSSDAGILSPPLWSQVGVFGLACLFMLARPARRGHNQETAAV